MGASLGFWVHAFTCNMQAVRKSTFVADSKFWRKATKNNRCSKYKARDRKTCGRIRVGARTQLRTTNLRCHPWWPDMLCDSILPQYLFQQPRAIDSNNGDTISCRYHGHSLHSSAQTTIRKQKPNPGQNEEQNAAYPTRHKKMKEEEEE